MLMYAQTNNSGQGMLCTVRGRVFVATWYRVRHMCLHLVVIDRVDQRMSVAL